VGSRPWLYSGLAVLAALLAVGAGLVWRAQAPPVAVAPPSAVEPDEAEERCTHVPGQRTHPNSIA